MPVVSTGTGHLVCETLKPLVFDSSHTATLSEAAWLRSTIANAQSRQITVAYVLGRSPAGSISATTRRECARVTRPHSGHGEWLLCMLRDISLPQSRHR